MWRTAVVSQKKKMVVFFSSVVCFTEICVDYIAEIS